MTERELDTLTEEIVAVVKKRLLAPILEAQAADRKAIMEKLAELAEKQNATHEHVTREPDEDEDEDEDEDDGDGLPKWLNHPLIAPHAGTIIGRLAEPGAVDRLLDKFLGPADKK